MPKITKATVKAPVKAKKAPTKAKRQPSAAFMKPVQPDEKLAKVVGDNVIVREGPSTDDDRVGKVKAGAIAKIVDRKGEWYKLKFTYGTAGWVKGGYLAPMGASEVAKIEKSRGVRPLEGASE